MKFYYYFNFYIINSNEILDVFLGLISLYSAITILLSFL